MDWKIIQLFLTMFFTIFAVEVTATEKPIVKLAEYSAIGFQNATKNGISANIFLGLPYAKPPINELRFEKTEALPSTPSKIVDATKWPHACHQVANIAHWGYTTSEDCLYLNIFTPAKSDKKNLPVLIFIHGGGFEYGFTQAYGYEYFVDNFISQDIIMVTLQYRLAHFGFMATSDHKINGNFGHFDQIEALKFIKKNIAAFGGDPNRITLSGHSAGSISTHTLSLTPKAKGLFEQEIHIAGSNYCQLAVDAQFIFDHSELISNAVGCAQSDTAEKKECLKKIDYQKFWEVRKHLNLSDFPYDTNHYLYWAGVNDDELFDGKQIDELQANAENRNILYGIDSGEGLLWTIKTENPMASVFSYGRGFTPEDRTKANSETIKKFFEMLLSNSTSFPSENQEETMQKLLDFYKIDDQYVQNNPLYYFEKFTEVHTDTVMKVPMAKEIDAKLDLGFKNQYMFQFNYVRPQDRPILGNLPPHGYFLLYFAGVEPYTTSGITNTDEEKMVQKYFAEMLGSFVKTGKPTANNITIPKITKDKFPYMNVAEDVSLGDDEFDSKLQFWKELEKSISYDIIRSIPLEKENDKTEL